MQPKKSLPFSQEPTTRLYLRHMKSVHNFPSYFPTFDSNITLPPTLSSSGFRLLPFPFQFTTCNHPSIEAVCLILAVTWSNHDTSRHWSDVLRLRERHVHVLF